MIEPSQRLAGDDGQTLVWFPDHGRGPRGGFSTLNISAWPNDASVCSLSSILETGPIPQRFYLSPKACAGILRRAGKRGKSLPEPLHRALVAVATQPMLGLRQAARRRLEREHLIAKPRLP